MSSPTDEDRRDRRGPEDRRRRRIVLVVIVVAALAVAGVVAYALTRDDDAGSSSGTTTTTRGFPSSSSASAGSTTTRPAASSTASSVPLPPPEATPQGYAQALFDAWRTGNRGAATAVATTSAINTIFAESQSEAAAYTFASCEGAAGSVYCSWTRPGGQLQMQVRDATGGQPLQVLDVTIGPA